MSPEVFKPTQANIVIKVDEESAEQIEVWALTTNN